MRTNLLPRALIIDNHDSFTWNLAHLVAQVTGALPDVVLNDHPDPAALLKLPYTHIILSPGPGHPARDRDFGLAARFLAASPLPILGICLGHQGLAHSTGARVALAPEPIHGRLSRIHHTATGLFAGIPQEFEAVRYHSLIVEPPLSADLEPLAWTSDGLLMALRHRSRPQWGVQFHPESILTAHGVRLLANFFSLTTHPSLQIRRAPYVDPANLFTAFAHNPNAFWLDGDRVSYMGASESVEDDLPSGLVTRLPDPALPFPFQCGWVGSIAFAHQLATARKRLLRVRSMAVFDHAAKALYLVHEGDETEAGKWFNQLAPVAMPAAQNHAPTFTWSQSRTDYLKAIAEAQQLIRQGESYEICLTNQLHAPTTQDPLAYYLRLRELTHAPCAAYLRFDDLHIACASPERFLSVTFDGHLEARPIKGTADSASDPALLAADPKARAEHLMIVDLLRNDLGRVSQPGTVAVPSLFAIETHGNVHQMVSTVTGRLRPGLTALDALDAAFPGGSMTGAPKERTLEILSRLEPLPRGIYSGCIGYLSHTGAADFNIVIRTAIFQGGEVTIGSGGALVALSDPAAEWDEIELKTQRLRDAFRDPRLY